MEIKETENPVVSEHLSADDIRDLRADVTALIKKFDKSARSCFGMVFSWMFDFTRADLVEFRGALSEFAADLEQAALASDVKHEVESGETYAPPLTKTKK